MGDFIINGKTVASLQIGGKEVIRIADGQTVLWEKTSPQPVSDYLCFTANAANCTVGMTHNGTNQTTTQPVMYYSTDQTNWTLWDYSNITLANVGDKVYFYGNNPNGFSSSSSNYSKFTTSGSVACSGNIMTLITRDGSETTIPSDYCFNNLFYNTSITTAPELPATVVSQYAYYNMFEGCTSLVTAPELPATTLAFACYNGMFKNCSSMTTAPSVLPAITASGNCYQYMFRNCTSMTRAPELKATTLEWACYNSMFLGCSQLNYIKVCATTWSTSFGNWVNGVAATGTFVKPAELVIGTGTGEIPLNATNGIPTGWTVQNTNDYLCFTANSANSTIGLENGPNNSPTLYYSTDNGTSWSQWDYSTITLQNVGDKVYFYGDNPNGVSTSRNAYSSFKTTNGSCTVSGNIMSLIHYSCPNTIPNAYCFNGLFQSTTITSAANLILPATTLTDHCYAWMFWNCSNLVIPPQLPATTLATYCYFAMFFGNSSLTSAPELNAATLLDYSYAEMFDGCSLLNSITCLATSISATHCTYYWLNDVAATGTFTKDSSMSSWTTGIDGIPSGWTVQDYQ